MPVSRIVPLLLVLPLVLAACDGGAAAPDCPAEAPSPLPAPPHDDDPELAERIPDEVSGRPLDVETICATVAGRRGLTTAPQMLDELGVDLADVTVALTPAPGPGETDYVGVSAWRYAGAEEEAIRTAFRSLLEEAEIPVERDTVAGKEVDRAQFHVYYVAGDTLYSVLAEDADVAEVIEALP